MTKTLRKLFGIILLDQVYLTIAFPLLTLIFFDSNSRLFPSDASHAVRSTWYGLCIALPSLLNIFFAPFLSTLSDEVGRKKILLLDIFGAFIFTLTVGFGIYTGTLWLVFAGFVVKGAFSRVNPIALAIIGDTTSKDSKVLNMSYLQFAISIGAAIGPILGGYFATQYFIQLNFALPLFIASGLAFINCLIAYFFMPETLQKSETHPKPISRIENLKRVFAHKEVWRIASILLLIQISWSTYYQFIPPILKSSYQFDSHALGWFIGMIAFWLALTTGVGMRFLHRYLNEYQMLLTAVYLVLGGLILSILSCAHLLPFDNWVIYFAAFPVAAGDVIAYSCLTAMFSNVVSKDQQGKVMGVVFIIAGLAWSTTGLIGGMLMAVSPLLPLIAAPLSILLCLGLVHAPFGKKLALHLTEA